jgi:prolyl 4-hydroxylase
MLTLYRRRDLDMGAEQIIDSKRAEEVKERLHAAQDYLKNVVSPDLKLRPLLEGCKLKHANCAFWATLGECENNPGYMTLNCAPVCQSCDQLSIETRCPIDLEKMPNTWKPGDVNEFFTNLTTMEEYAQYEPRVLSRPSLLPGDTEETVDYLFGGSWAVLLENFLSDEEAERLIELGAAEGYKRSADVGKAKFDGTYDTHIGSGRTSHNSWCQNSCYEDTIAQRIIQKITDVTNVPEENSEYLQMLRYDVGEYYQTHHDYIKYQAERQSGVRIMTVYMYLNDVEEGGGTSFPHLGITVQPKRGHALLWPSVLDEDPHKKDVRTEHTALPVIKGVKYGANAWVHQRDFKTPNKSGCN